MMSQAIESVGEFKTVFLKKAGCGLTSGCSRHAPLAALAPRAAEPRAVSPLWRSMMSNRKGVSRQRTEYDKTSTAQKYSFISTIVAASIGLIGALLAAYIGYVGIRVQVERPLQATQTAEAALASIQINAFYSPGEDTMTADVEGNEYRIIPSGCITLKSQIGSFRIERQQPTETFTLDLVTDKTIVISSLDIKMISFSPPPPQHAIRNVRFLFGLGGGGYAPIVTFSPVNIDSKSTVLRIRGTGGAYRLDPGDAVSFAIPITFKEQGLYSFQIILTGQSPLGKSTNFFSPVINYGWVEVGEFSGITLEPSDFNFNIVSCQ
jgi:hypothetical protein